MGVLLLLADQCDLLLLLNLIGVTACLAVLIGGFTRLPGWSVMVRPTDWPFKSGECFGIR